MIGFRICRIHNPEVGILPRAPGRDISNRLAAGRPGPLKIAGLPVGEKCAVAGGHVVAKELVPLAAAHILLKDKVVTAIRVERAAINGFRKKRELLPRPTGHFDKVSLVGIREASGNEQLTTLRMPGRRERRATFLIPS